MGELIKGSGEPYERNKRASWYDATLIALAVAKEVGIKPAIVGSFAHQSMIGRELPFVMDLDVFLMGPPALREDFRKKAVESWSPGYPDLDTPNLLHITPLIFNNEGEAGFQYGKRNFSVHPSVFETYKINIDGCEFPVLHPKTNLKLIGLPPRYTKTERIDILQEVALLWEQRPDIADPNMASLDELERLIRRNPLWGVREWFYEAEKRGSRFGRHKESFRRKFPKVAAFLRQIVSG